MKWKGMMCFGSVSDGHLCMQGSMEENIDSGTG